MRMASHRLRREESSETSKAKENPRDNLTDQSGAPIGGTSRPLSSLRHDILDPTQRRLAEGKVQKGLRPVAMKYPVPINIDHLSCMISVALKPRL
jgi:hypothetical protein